MNHALFGRSKVVSGAVKDVFRLALGHDAAPMSFNWSFV